ncbi:MAG: A24 family peptidase C-terminal domain-containing protein [Asgard group archaeon]|nr:A24 family peptidase C-terminal domain-containing protein [Asgard group archaeon]
MIFDQIYEILVPTLVLASLLYGGIQDLLYREVRHEFIWLFMFGSGIILDIFYIIFADDSTIALLNVLLSILIAFLLGLVLFYLGFWGGADTKALWSLGVLSPVYPFQENLLGLEFLSITFIDTGIFSIFINSILLSLIYPIILLIINTIKSTKNDLFSEVKATTADKFRAFLVGYPKKVDSISYQKLHYDFLEELPTKIFEGKFTGDFEGWIDGEMLGFFSGTLQGQINGLMTGRFIKDSDNYLEGKSIKQIISDANLLKQKLPKKNTISINNQLLLDGYRELHMQEIQKNKIDSTLQNIQTILQFNGKIENSFLGYFEGYFKGKLSGTFLGKLSGDLDGFTPKGQLEGTSKNITAPWRFRFRIGMEEEEIMEQRQLRTLLQLQKHDKKMVWVTPGLPFVFFLFIGYIFYLLFGNVLLLLFGL